MGPGLWGLAYVFIQRFGGDEQPAEKIESKQKKQKSRLSQKIDSLKPEDRALVYSVATKLLKYFTLHNAPDAVVAVTLRESKSWTKVRTELIGFRIQNDPKHVKALWKARWEDRIVELGGYQAHFLETGKLLRTTNKNSEPELYQSIRKTMVTAQGEILNRVKDAAAVLKNEMQDKTLTADPTCKRIMEYLDANWPYLTVFATWPEVPMDAEKRVFRIHSPTKEELVKTRRDNLALLTTDVSKIAVILAKRSDTELTVQDYVIAPDPVPPAMKRKASSVQLFHEEYGFVQQDPFKELPKIVAAAQPSSRGDQLHHLFELTFEVVSQELAEKEGVEYAGPSLSGSQARLRIEKTFFWQQKKE